MGFCGAAREDVVSEAKNDTVLGPFSAGLAIVERLSVVEGALVVNTFDFPSIPGTPGSPGGPGRPAAPGGPGGPATPGSPCRPGDPGSPGGPTIPAGP